MGVVRNKLKKIKDMNNFKFLSVFPLFIVLLTSNVYSKPAKDKDEGTPQIKANQTKDNSSSTNECPQGWHLIQDTCYLFNKTILNFQNAQKWCKNQKITKQTIWFSTRARTLLKVKNGRLKTMG